MKISAFETINLEISEYACLRIENIHPDPSQPRRHFNDVLLNELATSIGRCGVLQPILVKKVDGENYQIIAGERRWRAARKASLVEIPCLIKTVDDKNSKLEALIENIQREDLNPIEEARSYKSLCENHRMTHVQVAELVGKSRSAVSNSLRLLELEDSLQQQVMERQLSAGHVKALLAIPEEGRAKAARHISDRQLNVREAEALAKNARQAEAEVETHLDLNNDITRLEKKLSRLFDSEVKLTQSGLRIRMIVEFQTRFELDSVMEILGNR